MEKLWFKAKNYGWGWYPVTWQGWLITTGFIVLLVWNAFRLDTDSHSASDTIRPYLIQTAVIVGVLIWICYKTGEKPEWRWRARRIFREGGGGKKIRNGKEENHTG